MVVNRPSVWFFTVVGGIDMGWGIEHTPFYIPDPRDPYDLAETSVSHALWGFATYGAAGAYSGIWPGPGHFGSMYYAFFSRKHVGAAYAGANAFDDTMFALSVYSEPFRFVGRALSKVAVPLAIVDIGYQTYSDPSDNPFTRGYEASPISLFFGDHLVQQHGIRGGIDQGFENLKKNFHLA
jgi:hypothetical protein